MKADIKRGNEKKRVRKTARDNMRERKLKREWEKRYLRERARIRVS